MIGLAVAVLFVAGCMSTGPVWPAETYLPGSSPISATPSSGPAEWWIDPAQLPLPQATTTIRGFLVEQACASGQSPEGRIVGPEITYRAEAVVVTFRVHAIGRPATCQGNPHYPVTVELGEPLGRRAVIDGGSGRDATVDPTIVLVPAEDCGPIVGTDDAKSACQAFIVATLGDREYDFARWSVVPEGGSCSGDACTSSVGIAARTWQVDATDRQGQSYAWRCSYRDEVASCEQSVEPSPS